MVLNDVQDAATAEQTHVTESSRGRWDSSSSWCVCWEGAEVLSEGHVGVEGSAPR